MTGGNERNEATRVLARVGAIGIEIAVAICLGLFAGDYADKRWGTAPWLTIGGLVVGCAIAVRILVGVARALREDENG